jgi:hypothetical protein
MRLARRDRPLVVGRTADAIGSRFDSRVEDADRSFP